LIEQLVMSAAVGGDGSETAVGSLFALEPDAVRCPHVALGALREESPVRWIAEIEAYAVTRYDDIVEVNRHPELFSSTMATGPVFARQLMETITSLLDDEAFRDAVAPRLGRGLATALLNADPPLHSRQRALVNRAFSLRKAREREAAIVEITDGLIDRFVERGEAELVTELAVPLPLTVIAQLLGVPTDDMDAFKRWSDDFVVAIGNHNLSKDDLAAMLRSQGEFFEYFGAQIADRRVAPRDDVVSDVVHARIDSEELTEAEMLSMFSQFLVAGNETTTKLIASAVLWLVRRPDLADRLRAQPGDVAPFIEEILRLEAPVQGLFRVATADTTVGGVDIPSGAAVWLAYASGNRDGSAYTDADECLVDREPGKPHLAFGVGEHFCLGASLARVESQVAIQRLLARLDDIRLAVPDEDLGYEPSYVLHGLHRLPITFTPTRRSDVH
jgi:cytochrome P450